MQGKTKKHDGKTDPAYQARQKAARSSNGENHKEEKRGGVGGHDGDSAPPIGSTSSHALGGSLADKNLDHEVGPSEQDEGQNRGDHDLMITEPPRRVSLNPLSLHSNERGLTGDALGNGCHTFNHDAIGWTGTASPVALGKRRISITHP